MASHPATTAAHEPTETNSSAFFKVASMLLGIAVAVVGFFALMMWADARDGARLSSRGRRSHAGSGRPTTRPITTPPCR